MIGQPSLGTREAGGATETTIAIPQLPGISNLDVLQAARHA